MLSSCLTPFVSKSCTLNAHIAPLQVEKVLKQVRDRYDCVHGVANCIGDASIMKPAHITSEVRRRIRRRPIVGSWKGSGFKCPGHDVSVLAIVQDEYEHAMRTNVKTAFNILKVSPCGSCHHVPCHVLRIVV